MLYHLISLKEIPVPVFAHVYSCPSYASHFRVMAPNIEIAYIQTGAVDVEILGETFTAKEKSFLILPHGYDFVVRTKKNASHIHYTVSAAVDAHARVVQEVPASLPEGVLCVPFCPECGAETERLASLLNSAICEYQNDDSISRTKCGALFAVLLADLSKAAFVAAGKSGAKRADILDARIKKYIEKNLNHKITLADIAEFIGKNPNYLNQVFGQKNHTSIISYVNLLKMQRVAALIADKSATLEEAAKEVGLRDISYLSRLFKAKMGMTISEFKANSVDYTFALNDRDKIFGAEKLSK